MPAHPAFHPFGDRLLVRPFEEPPATTPGGLVIPDTARNPDRYVLAEVVVTGPGRNLPDGTWVDNQTHPGDQVYIKRDVLLYSDKVPHLDEKLTMIRWEDVAGRAI